jgi:hypothetical protein
VLVLLMGSPVGVVQAESNVPLTLPGCYGPHFVGGLLKLGVAADGRAQPAGIAVPAAGSPTA